MAITRDAARNAEAAVRQANSEADRLEAESRAARERAADMTKESANIVKQWARTEQDQRQANGNRLGHLSAAVDAVLREKPDTTRVQHDTRRYARSMLANYILGGDGPPPELRDPLWGRLHGLQGQVIALMGTLSDEDHYDAADTLECRLHRACLARLRWLAGEA